MVALVSTIILAAMLTNAYFQFRDEIATMDEVLKTRAQSLGQMVASISLDALLVYDAVSLNTYIRYLTEQEQVVHAVILDTSKNPLTTYVDNSDFYINDATASGAVQDSAALVSALQNYSHLKVFNVPVMFEDVMLARTVLVIDDSEYVQRASEKFEEKVLITVFIGLFVGLGIYYIFNMKVLWPVRRLSDSATRIARSEFSRVDDVTDNNELGDLASNFNKMSENIESLIGARDEALGELEELNRDLEKRVKDRTLELQALNVEIAHQAMHDPLTELPNRTLLVERLKQNITLAKRHSTRVAFIMLDLNNFKDVNDTLGHPEGDRLLQEVASRLPSALRESDTVGRLGGDEFGIVLPDIDREKAIDVAKKVLLSLEPSFELGNQLLTIGASIGIALYPEHGEDDASLIRHADVAMYEAKRNRSEPCLYDPDQDHYTTTRLALMADLHQAVDNDQIELFYQPQLELRTEKVYAVEALLRWNHPEHGYVSPEYFIPMAETSDLIHIISDWVLDKAIQQLAVWQKQGLDIYVAINLSARYLLNLSLAETVTRLCEKYDVTPSRLKIEITESVIMSHPEQVIDLLDHPVLAKLNYAIDDFGTGYSSLSYLKKLPIREVKIDKSFVIDMAEDQDDASIVRSVIELAHSLGHIVVAEGVETATVLEQLRELGCDMVQGFYFSPAVEVSKLPEVIAKIENGEHDSAYANIGSNS